MNKNELHEYIKKAEEGDANSQVLLGLTYLNGDDEIPANEKEAFKWFNTAAAQNSLGNCYYNRQGVRQDYNEAFRWYKAAAEQGFAPAQCNLAVCYYNGRGVKQDYNEAFRWFKAAAEQGHAKAQYNLGVCYSNGLGVIQDYKEAYYWYLISYRNGYTAAEQDVKRIEDILTYQQKQEVQDRVNEWFKTHPKE